MSESQPNQIRIRTSVWHTDYLGDLLAEGVIDIDDVSAQAIFEEQSEDIDDVNAQTISQEQSEVNIHIIRVGKKWEDTPVPYCPQPDDDEDENLDIF